MKTPKKYLYKNRFLTVSELMDEPEINLSRKTIYNRLNKYNIEPNQCVKKIFDIKPRKKKATPKKKPSTKKYMYDGQLMTIKDIHSLPEITLSLKAIYNRINEAETKPKSSVKYLFSVADKRLKVDVRSSGIHDQKEELERVKKMLGLTWDELAVKFGMKPRTFMNYRLPSTSKEFRKLKQHHYDKLELLKCNPSELSY